MPGLDWNMSFDNLVEPRSKDLDPPGYDSGIAKEGPVGKLYCESMLGSPLLHVAWAQAVLPLGHKKQDTGMLQRKQGVSCMAA